MADKPYIVNTAEGQKVIEASSKKAAIAKLTASDDFTGIDEMNTEAQQLCPDRCTLQIWSTSFNYCPNCGVEFI